MVLKMTHAAATVSKWDEMTTAELVKAIELMIAPEDLTIREAAIALLEVFSYEPDEVKEFIADGAYLNTGWAFFGLETQHPKIISNI
jgi:hypothetical protein